MSDLIARLRELHVSHLCDVDKRLPTLDPAIRPLQPGARMAGPAVTIEADREHLSVLSALRDAAPGEVLVCAARGEPFGAFGELIAAEARRKGLAGIVVDGYCRDRHGLLDPALPIYARGTTPMAGSASTVPKVGGEIVVGGVVARPGDIVFGDDDGLAIASRERVEALIDAAEEVCRQELAVLDAVRAGTSFFDLLNFDQHLERVRAGQPSGLEYQPPERRT